MSMEYRAGNRAEVRVMPLPPAAYEGIIVALCTSPASANSVRLSPSSPGVQGHNCLMPQTRNHNSKMQDKEKINPNPKLSPLSTPPSIKPKHEHYDLHTSSNSKLHMSICNSKSIISCPSPNAHTNKQRGQ